jgi:hypothetical protein
MFQIKNLAVRAVKRSELSVFGGKVGMKISKEWSNNEVSYNGENRAQQLRSLRKKIAITKKVRVIKLL